MSTLTKVCVVVLVLLLLFACPVFIQQAVTGPNYRQAFLNEQADRELAEAEAKNSMLAAQVYESLYNEAQKDADAAKLLHNDKTAGKNVEISRLTSRLAKLAGKEEELIAFNTAIERDLNEQIKLNKTLQQHLGKQRKANIELNDQLRQAQHTIKQDQANIEILTRSVRVLQEQVARKSTELTELRDQLAAGGIKVGPAVTAVKAPKLDATVTAVKDDLASLSIGSASGVKKDMEFIIYRGADFVAHLRIADVGVSSSTGIITDATRAVKVNDKATTDLK